MTSKSLLILTREIINPNVTNENELKSDRGKERLVTSLSWTRDFIEGKTRTDRQTKIAI